MGYELHITRRKQWFEGGDDITKEEFVACVRSDSEFSYPGTCGDDFADWTNRSGSYTTWLQWSEGRIDTKNPEPEFVDKMVEVAGKLNATVQGDDGETYHSSTVTVPPGPAPAPQSGNPAKAVSWTGRALLFAIIALFAALYFVFR